MDGGYLDIAGIIMYLISFSARVYETHFLLINGTLGLRRKWEVANHLRHVAVSFIGVAVLAAVEFRTGAEVGLRGGSIGLAWDPRPDPWTRA
jgi:hypothetical protein